jgi:hypothetical protein
MSSDLQTRYADIVYLIFSKPSSQTNAGMAPKTTLTIAAIRLLSAALLTKYPIIRQYTFDATKSNIKETRNLPADPSGRAV